MSVFRVWPYRFHFVALDPVRIPRHKGDNVFRGAFGTIFRRIACEPDCPGSNGCPVSQTCPYAWVFEPRWEGGPSGLADAPRAFVLRAGAAEGDMEPGDRFSIDLHVFSGRPDLLEYFVLTFRQLADEGIGTGRGRAQLIQVTHLDKEAVETTELFTGGRLLKVRDDGLAWEFDDTQREPTGRIRVRFRTPTELKAASGGASGHPEFGVLVRRLINRVGNLAALYQGGAFAIDYRALAERADRVKVIGSDSGWRNVERRSSRTGQRHSLGGFVGWVEYEGPVGEFLPWLELARWVGVGRQTVWGKGWVEVADSPIIY